jgi:RNA polymerase sigma-70 factor (ECF subfamily)
MFFNKLEKKSDEDLMCAVQHGDRKAMTVLYRRYATPLLRYFHRMLWKKETLAQDFLHDLFVKIIDHPEYFKATFRFSTWVYSIAHNMCKNEYRKQNFRKQLSSRADEISGQDSHDHFVAREFMEALDSALDQLSEDDKNIFVLRHELDLPVQEIATMVNLPEGTVKSKLFYIKKKLAGQLVVFQNDALYGKK